MSKSQSLAVCMLLCLCLCLCLPTLLFAKEGGDQFSNGGENWAAGVFPPPGFYWLNTSGFIDGTLHDANGDRVRAPDANGNLRDVRNRALFNTFRFVHLTKLKLGSASYGWQVIVPTLHRMADIPQLGSKKSTTGFGDMIISPVLLHWRHSQNLQSVLAASVFFPVGHYDNNDPRKRLGVNYMSIEPAWAVTWKQPDGWEVSAKFMYNLKTEHNDKTGYRSGDEFHLDFMAGHHFGAWGAGLAGFYLKQIEDDKIGGVNVGNRGQAFAVGPTLKYTVSPGFQVIGTWLHETSVKNRFGDNRFLLKMVIAL